VPDVPAEENNTPTDPASCSEPNSFVCKFDARIKGEHLGWMDMLVRHTLKQTGVPLRVLGSQPAIPQPVSPWLVHDVQLIVEADREDAEAAIRHLGRLLGLPEIKASRVSLQDVVCHHLPAFFDTRLSCPAASLALPQSAHNGNLERYELRGDVRLQNLGSARLYVLSVTGVVIKWETGFDWVEGGVVKDALLVLSSNKVMPEAIQLFGELVLEGPFTPVRLEGDEKATVLPGSPPQVPAFGIVNTGAPDTNSKGAGSPLKTAAAPATSVSKNVDSNSSLPGGLSSIVTFTPLLPSITSMTQVASDPAGIAVGNPVLPSKTVDASAAAAPTSVNTPKTLSAGIKPASVQVDGQPAAQPFPFPWAIPLNEKAAPLGENDTGAVLAPLEVPVSAKIDSANADPVATNPPTNVVGGIMVAQMPASPESCPVISPNATPQQAPKKTICDIALFYESLGLGVVPQLPGAKRPCVALKPFREKRPCAQDLQQWFGTCWPHAAVAALLGPVSDLVAVAVNGDAAHNALVAMVGEEPKAPKVLNGNQDSYHLLFKSPKNVVTEARMSLGHEELELLGEKGILVLPSLPEQETSSHWAPGQSLKDIGLPELPPAVLASLEKATSANGPAGGKDSQSSGQSNTLLQSSPLQRRAQAFLAKVPRSQQGEETDRHAYVARVLMIRFGLNLDQALPLLTEWNTKCIPPRSEADLQHELSVAMGNVSMMAVNNDDDPLAAVAPSWSDYLYDFGMVDQSRAELFELLGTTHETFAGMANWPSLAQLRKQHPGPIPWEAQIRAVADGPGGLIATTPKGRTWALRLLPMINDVDGPYHVLGICLEHAIQEFGLGGTGAQNQPVPPPCLQEDVRKQLGRVARELRLFRKAEQLLWLAHAAMLKQSSSRLDLPDVGIAEVLWGADTKAWPRNWRQHIFCILKSLTVVWSKTLQNPCDLLDTASTTGGFETIFRDVIDRRPGSTSKANNGEKQSQNLCSEKCPLWGSGSKHHHFSVGVGPAFVKSLDNFRVGNDEQDEAIFNFNPNLKEKLLTAKDELEEEYSDNSRGKSKALKATREEVRQQHKEMFQGIVKVPLTVHLFGPLAGISGRHRRLLRVMVRETTRAQKKGNDKRPDGAHVFQGNCVPGYKNKQRLVCPLLDAQGCYVGFNGNGKTWGRGYRVTTWMSRCGYAVVSESNESTAKGVQRFLKDLHTVASRFGLVVGGLLNKKWYTLQDLLAMAGSTGTSKKLITISLRLYADAHYDRYWRRQLSLTMPPGQPAKPLQASPGVDLKVRLEKAGISQQMLAKHLKKSRTYINKLLNGQKPFPLDLRSKAETLVAGKMGAEQA
jgi:hypothetical protein